MVCGKENKSRNQVFSCWMHEKGIRFAWMQTLMPMPYGDRTLRFISFYT